MRLLPRNSIAQEQTLRKPEKKIVRASARVSRAVMNRLWLEQCVEAIRRFEEPRDEDAERRDNLDGLVGEVLKILAGLTDGGTSVESRSQIRRVAGSLIRGVLIAWSVKQAKDLPEVECLLVDIKDLTDREIAKSLIELRGKSVKSDELWALVWQDGRVKIERPEIAEKQVKLGTKTFAEVQTASSPKEISSNTKYRRLLEKRLLGTLTEAEEREYEAARRALLAHSKTSAKRQKEIESTMKKLEHDKPRTDKLMKRYLDRA